ncbi:hypothetical protein FJZ26_03940 [Candidatus Parvarchaeota archaeon]|nr:hypothetical protein [Candidatus Parvarchaeota archaeon]
MDGFFKLGLNAGRGLAQSAVAKVAGRLQFWPIVYGYSNARLHAMKSLLMGPAQVEELLAASNMQGMIQVLEKSGYKEDIAAYSLKYSGSQLVEHAIGRNYARVAKKVLGFTPKDGRETVEGYLERYDVNNLKAILVGKYLKKPRAQIEDKLIPVGQMGPLEISQLLDAQSVEDALAIIRTHRYGGELWGMRRESFESILAALDRFYYMNVQKKVTSTDPKAQGVLRLLKTELDGKNVSTIMRCKKNGLEKSKIADFVIDSGNFTTREIGEMIEADGIGGVGSVAARRYWLGKANERFAQTGRVSEFEIEFSRIVASIGLQEFRKSTLSVGAIVGFLMIKGNGMNNIGKIAQAKEFGLPAQVIREIIIET